MTSLLTLAENILVDVEFFGWKKTFSARGLGPVLENPTRDTVAPEQIVRFFTLSSANCRGRKASNVDTRFFFLLTIASTVTSPSQGASGELMSGMRRNPIASAHC